MGCMTKFCSEKPLTRTCQIGTKKRGSWQETLCLHGSKALHHSKLLLCQKGQRTKMGWDLEVSTAANGLQGPCVCNVAHPHPPAAAWRDKLNTCSFILVWLSCVTANLSCFLSKLATSLSHKHLSRPLCTLTSQLCSFFVWRRGRWIDAKRHQTYILTGPIGFCTQSQSKGLGFACVIVEKNLLVCKMFFFMCGIIWIMCV